MGSWLQLVLSCISKVWSLANAYDELIDADVLRSRFEADNAERAKLGLHVMPIDEYLLAALPHMSECAGIALGIRSIANGGDESVKT